jgi:hypothetical protein
MAQETVETIIRKAVSDEAFRALLVNNPAEALTGYDLTDEERAGLTNLDQSIFDGDGGSLEDRLSRGIGFN